MKSSLSRTEVLASCGTAVRELNPHLFIDPNGSIGSIGSNRIQSAPPVEPSPRPRMTKTEQRYGDLLLARRLAGEILEARFEVITLRLGADCRYTPDFLVVTTTGLELHEVKGARVEEDARVKFRTAVEQFPFFRFIWAQWADGRWSIREHAPTTTTTTR